MAIKYNKDSISSYTPLEITRLKPGLYAGDITYSTQLIKEVVMNAVDEFNLGNGSIINITINKDIFKVEDFAQGFPVNVIREDGETVLQASFDVLNTSAKVKADGTYEGISNGMYGVGNKITNFLSHWLTVETYNNGQFEKIWFKEGVFEKREIGETERANGTIVSWQPSEEFFTHTECEIDKLKNELETTSCVCSGLTFNLNYNNQLITYYSENGLNDLVNKGVGNTELIENRFHLNFNEKKNKLELILTYTSNYDSKLIPFVNSGLTESGQHITQIRTIITREFNKFFRDKKWLKDKEENLTGNDIQEGMYILFNITAPDVVFDAQVKNRVVKIDMTPFTRAIIDNLEAWMNANEKEVKLIADKAINARKAREAAKKARDNARAQVKKKEKALKFDSKLADCKGKPRKDCEIYITEGDSASGNLKLARDNSFQAVMPVRGKILNTQKATLDKIQKNAEIMTMIDAFGLTVDMKTMKITYRPEDLRYGKIIIESDADVDGAHIKNLFYTFIWNFCPQLIEDGYVYAGVPPLYKITLPGNKGYKYLKDDAALEEFRINHKDGKYQVNRLKGLGEMSVEETEETLTDPNNRIIKQITINDVKAVDELFETLMGSSASLRKEYIRSHSEEAGRYNME